jgi:hypothetical protein
MSTCETSTRWFSQGRGVQLNPQHMLSLQKVYDVVRNDTVDAVVRVASPAFPKDKLESEVINYLSAATHTQS